MIIIYIYICIYNLYILYIYLYYILYIYNMYIIYIYTYIYIYIYIIICVGLHNMVNCERLILLVKNVQGKEHCCAWSAEAAQTLSIFLPTVTLFFLYLDCIEEYFQLVMAGLAGSPHMISATLLAFTKLVFQYRGRSDLTNFDSRL